MNPRLIVLSFVFLAACAEARADEAQQPLAPSPSTLTDRAAVNELEREGKRAWGDKSPLSPTPQTVNWVEAAAFKQLPKTMLPTKAVAKLDAIKLPVLAFAEPALMTNARLSHFSNWYVLAVDSDDGLNMNIRGNRNAVTVPGMQIPPAARKAAANYTVTRTHAVVTMSWRAFGVSYSIDVECSKPMDDPRCTEDAFVLATAEKLGVIGGAQ